MGEGLYPKRGVGQVGSGTTKEKDAANISQSRPVSLLNVVGKVLFSIIAQRMAEYLK